MVIKYKYNLVEVEFTKIKIKTCYVRFFKESINMRAVTPTLELDESNVSTFAKFEYERSSSKTERVFEKTNMILCLFFIKVRQPFELQVQLMLK